MLYPPIVSPTALTIAFILSIYKAVGPDPQSARRLTISLQPGTTYRPRTPG